MKKWYFIGILLFGIGAALLFSNLPVAKNINYYAYDLLLSSTYAPQIDSSIVIIGIDDKSLQRFNDPLVLWHKYLSKMINALSDSGAREIALDIVPSISLDRFAPELDRMLIRSMKDADTKGTSVYLGFKAGETGIVPHRKFLFASSGMGFLNLYPDEDRRIRKQRNFLENSSGRKILSLPSLVVQAGNTVSLDNIPSDLYIDYRLDLPRILSYQEVYNWAENNQIDILKEAFKDKIVFIGALSSKFPDMFMTPVRSDYSGNKRIPGVLIHALTAKTILSRNILREVSPGVLWSLAAVISFISGLLFLVLAPRKAFAVLSLMLIFVVFGVYHSFLMYRVVPAAPLMFGLFIPGLISGTYRYTIESQQFRRLQHYFQSYVNPQVMKEIIDKPEQVSFEGKQVVATVMFVDIRNFTTISEQLDSKDVVAGLNRYFTEITRIIVEVGGYLNHYLGDGILAVFGAPVKLPYDGAWAAVRCGLKIRESVNKLDSSAIFPAIYQKLQVGIGIHTGEAIVGNIGCYEKMDYSIIGDTVNLASRIENITKEYQRSLLISEATYEKIKDRIEARFIASTKVKGRVQEVKLYEVLSIKEE